MKRLIGLISLLGLNDEGRRINPSAHVQAQRDRVSSKGDYQFMDNSGAYQNTEREAAPYAKGDQSK